MIISSSHKLDPRIVEHNFSCLPLNMLELSYPHLIIDMAHLFTYGLNKTVWWSGYYDHLYKHPNIRLEMMPIKSIYIGWNNKKFAKKKLIEILPSGYIRTFIDCLEDSGFINYNVEDPVELLNEIIKNIKIDLMKIWRERKNGVRATEAGGHFDEMFASFSLMDQLLDKLFSNKTKEQILDFSTYSNHEEFNIKLNDSTYI